VEMMVISYFGTVNSVLTKACDWLLFPGDQQWPTPGNLSGTPTGIVTLPNMTLIKTRVNLFAQTQTGATPDHNTMGLGIIEFESKRTTPAPNVNDVPSPSADSADWIWQLEVPFLKQQFAGNQSASLVDPFQIHSRAQRKLPSGSGILIIADWTNFSGIARDITFNATIQLWFKLPS